ncbi:MAG: hypothetical protein ACRC8S_10100 [Fimbriiglobus sp.]
MRGKRMVFALLFLATIGAIGYLIWPQAPQPVEQLLPLPPVPMTLQQQIVSDLKLVARLKSPQPIRAGSGPHIEVTLTNTSKTSSHRVVKPGHGSEIGTREPSLKSSGTIDRGDGIRFPLPVSSDRAYCGTCLASSANWYGDVVTLEPGQSIEVDGGTGLEYQQAGRVQLQTHYIFNQGQNAIGAFRDDPEQRQVMDGVPPFELVSNVVEFDVIRPYDVRIRLKRPIKLHEEVQLMDLFEVSLANQSTQSLINSGGLIGIQICQRAEPRQHVARPAFGRFEIIEELPPGAVRTLVLTGQDVRQETLWQAPGKRPLMARAACDIDRDVIDSEWVEFEPQD